MIYKTVIETKANTKFEHGPFGSREHACNFAIKTAKMGGVTKVTVYDANGVEIATYTDLVAPKPQPQPCSVYGKEISLKSVPDRCSKEIPPVPVKSTEPLTPKTKSTTPSKEATMNRYVEETNNKRSNVSFILLMLLGALLSSATWSGALYGPDAVNSIVKWWNAPPELSDLGQKISDMLDNDDEWEHIYGDTIKHKTKGFRISKGASAINMYDDRNQSVTECLTPGDNSWLFKKVTPLIKSFVDSQKAKEAAEIAEKLNTEKAALLKKLTDEKAALLKKLK